MQLVKAEDDLRQKRIKFYLFLASLYVNFLKLFVLLLSL